jgi:hypothetical protein
MFEPWLFFLPIWPYLHSLQYQFANFKNDGYNKTGKGYLKLQLINQREYFSFALFSGGLLKVNQKKKNTSIFWTSLLATIILNFWRCIHSCSPSEQKNTSVTAQADCCLQQGSICESKGTSVPTFGTREVLEWSKPSCHYTIATTVSVSGLHETVCNVYVFFEEIILVSILLSAQLCINKGEHTLWK